MVYVKCETPQSRAGTTRKDIDETTTRAKQYEQPCAVPVQVLVLVLVPQHIKRTNGMEQKQNGKPSVSSEAIAALLSASAGSGIGWLLWVATSNIGLAIGMAGPIAALSNMILRKIIK